MRPADPELQTPNSELQLRPTLPNGETLKKLLKFPSSLPMRQWSRRGLIPEIQRNERPDFAKMDSRDRKANTGGENFPAGCRVLLKTEHVRIPKTLLLFVYYRTCPLPRLRGVHLALAKLSTPYRRVGTGIALLNALDGSFRLDLITFSRNHYRPSPPHFPGPGHFVKSAWRLCPLLWGGLSLGIPLRRPRPRS